MGPRKAEPTPPPARADVGPVPAHALASSTERWPSQTARAYRDLGEQAHVAVLRPLLEELLGNLSSRRALDFGCGPARLSVALAELGAEEVVAMDRSPEILEEARRVIAASPPEIRGRIEVLRGDEQTLRRRRQWARKQQRRDERFDVVLSSLTLMMCPSRRCLRTMLGGLLEALRPGGVALVVITHPCFRRQGFPGFHYQVPADWSYWASGTRYNVVLHPEDDDLQVTLSDHHWTLTDYVGTIADVGGAIVDLREVPAERSPTGEPEGPPAYLALLVAARPTAGSRAGPVLDFDNHGE